MKFYAALEAESHFEATAPKLGRTVAALCSARRLLSEVKKLDDKLLLVE